MSGRWRGKQAALPQAIREKRSWFCTRRRVPLQRTAHVGVVVGSRPSAACEEDSHHANANLQASDP
jgi:hypothetical protein